MSRKSEVRSILAERFAQAFRSGTPLRDASLSIEDGMFPLQAFGHGRLPDSVTGGDVVRYVLEGAKACLRPETGVKTHVLIFDKAPFVPKIKGIEQARRAVRATGDAGPCPDIPVDTTRPLISFDETLPYSWQSMMANRNVRPRAISSLVELIVAEFWPPVGTRLIIDGGESPVVRESEWTPICIETTGEPPKCANGFVSLLRKDILFPDPLRGLSTRTVTRPVELRNRIGEADAAFVFYLLNQHCRDLCNRGRAGGGVTPSYSAFPEPGGSPSTTPSMPFVAAVYSRDTDYIPISLLLVDALRRNGGASSTPATTGHVLDVRLVMGANAAWGRTTSTDFVSCCDLYDRLRSSLSVLGDTAVASAVVAMIAAGNDYVDGFPGLTHKRVLTNFLDRAYMIGSLVRWDSSGRRWAVRRRRFARLIKLAYLDLAKMVDLVSSGSCATAALHQASSLAVNPVPRDRLSLMTWDRLIELVQPKIPRVPTPKRARPRLVSTFQASPRSTTGAAVSSSSSSSSSSSCSEPSRREATPASTDAEEFEFVEPDPPERRVLPSGETACLKWRRTDMCMMIMQCAPAESPDVLDELSLEFGYTRRDATAPFSRTNVRLAEAVDRDHIQLHIDRSTSLSPRAEPIETSPRASTLKRPRPTQGEGLDC